VMMRTQLELSMVSSQVLTMARTGFPKIGVESWRTLD